MVAAVNIAYFICMGKLKGKVLLAVDALTMCHVLLIKRSRNDTMVIMVTEDVITHVQ